MSLFSRLFDRLVKFVTPNEDRYFDMLIGVMTEVEGAAKDLGELSSASTDKWPALAKAIEVKIDSATHQVSNLSQQLRATFVTPIEKCDLIGLARAMLKVARSIHRAAETTQIYLPNDLLPGTSDMVGKIVEATALVASDVRNLRGHIRNHSKLVSIPAVDKLDREARRIHAQVIQSAGGSPNLSLALFLREVAEGLRRVEALASAVEDTVIVNS